jgi:tetratricopeptide (TPR) repeat protein
MTEDALKAGEPSMIQGCISVMFTPAAANGQLVAAARYLSLANELSPKESEWAAIYELRRASLDRDMGNLSSLAERIVTLKSLLPPTTLPSFDGDLASLEIYIAWAHGELTEERLNELTKRLFLGIHLPDRAMWWSAYWEQNDRYDLALQYAEDSLRLCRGRGLSTTFSEASVARILIQLGETTSARRVVEDVLMTLDRVAPGLRPYGVLADSLERLGEDENIADLAIDAYKVAWANGPPFAFDANLRAAQERLDRLRIPHPSLPTIDPETFTAPLEREIRAFIAAHLAKSPVPTNWPGLWEAGAP